MPRSPESASTGSPGIRRISEKTSSVMPRKVGTTRPRRLRTNVNMLVAELRPRACPHPGPLRWRERAEDLLAGHVDLVEVVVRGRIHLVAGHFLSHRVEAHRVRDRDPRRVVVRDLLRLG